MEDKINTVLKPRGRGVITRQGGKLKKVPPRGSQRSLSMEQAKEVVNLRTAGASFQQIADKFGTNKVTIYNTYNRSLREDSEHQDLSVIKQETLNQLELTLRQLISALFDSKEDASVLARLSDSIVKVLERKSKILGLDSAIKQNIRITHIDREAVIGELQRIEKELEERGIDPKTVIDVEAI